MQLLSIRKLLQHGLFTIPSYQRGYSWQQKQIQDLLEDLTEATSLQEHYTGTITVVEKGEKEVFPENFKIYDVVDGQQRLTTFTILIYCFHERLTKLNVDRKILDAIYNNICYGNITVLELQNDTQEFYHYFITKPETIDEPIITNKSQKNLNDAYHQITRFLSIRDNSTIQNLYTTLMNKLKINLYVLSKDSDVGVVFETMNNRGLNLTQMDMVKNYLIYLASRINSEDLAERINNNFGIIYRNLMEISTSPKQEDDILRYSYVILKGHLGNDIYLDVKTFCPKFDFKDNTTENIKTYYKHILDYVHLLVSISAVYKNLLSKKATTHKLSTKEIEIKDVTDRIIWLGSDANILPLLLSLFLTYNERENELIPILRVIEVYSFRIYKIANKQTKAGRKELHLAAMDVYKGVSLQKIEKELLSTINKYVDDADFKLALSNKNFYNSQESNEMCYFFYEYNQYLSKLYNSSSELLFRKFIEMVNSNKLSIEHIYPQTSQGEQDIESIHKLGNLTLTSQNSELSNKDFHIKKELYKKSDLLVERIISNSHKWNDQEINLRTKDLVVFAKERWKIK